MVEELVIEGDSRGDKLRYSSLDEFFRELRILKLVTDSDFVPCPDKFGEICVQSVVGEARHLDITLVPVGFPRLDDTENLADKHSVV